MYVRTDLAIDRVLCRMLTPAAAYSDGCTPAADLVRGDFLAPVPAIGGITRAAYRSLHRVVVDRVLCGPGSPHCAIRSWVATP